MNTATPTTTRDGRGAGRATGRRHRRRPHRPGRRGTRRRARHAVRRTRSRPRRRRRRRRVGARPPVLRVARARRPCRATPPGRRRALDRAGRGRLPDRSASGATPTCSRSRTCSTTRPAGAVRYGARVVGVSRAGRDLLVDSGRDERPVRRPRRDRRPVTNGCWPARSSTPRAPGRSRTRSAPTATRRWASARTPARVTYGIPDFADPAVAARYAGKHVAVAGKGASAQGVLIGLAGLAARDADGRGPGCPGCCAAPASATRSAAATTTSSRSAASSASRPRPPPAADWSPTSPSSAPSPSPARQTAG